MTCQVDAGNYVEKHAGVSVEQIPTCDLSIIIAERVGLVRRDSQCPPVHPLSNLACHPYTTSVGFALQALGHLADQFGMRWSLEQLGEHHYMACFRKQGQWLYAGLDTTPALAACRAMELACRGEASAQGDSP